MELTKQIKIEIRNRWTGSVVFEYTKEENTITETVLEAIRRGANLRDANLCDANLRDANLCDAKGCYLSCPTEGSFIGWKKASGHIVKLRIPEDARLSIQRHRRLRSGGGVGRLDERLQLRDRPVLPARIEYGFRRMSLAATSVA